jgi:hypothetical protein
VVLRLSKFGYSYPKELEISGHGETNEKNTWDF